MLAVPLPALKILAAGSSPMASVVVILPPFMFMVVSRFPTPLLPTPYIPTLTVPPSMVNVPPPLRRRTPVTAVMVPPVIVNESVCCPYFVPFILLPYMPTETPALYLAVFTIESCLEIISPSLIVKVELLYKATMLAFPSIVPPVIFIVPPSLATVTSFSKLAKLLIELPLSQSKSWYVLFTCVSTILPFSSISVP